MTFKELQETSEPYGNANQGTSLGNSTTGDSHSGGSATHVRSDVITYWAQAWADFFSRDPAVVEPGRHAVSDQMGSVLVPVQKGSPEQDERHQDGLAAKE